MGSLLPGWSTSPSNADQAMKRSSSSLTKEEVEKFWKTKRLLVQQHLEEANKDAAISPRTRIARAIAKAFGGWHSLVWRSPEIRNYILDTGLKIGSHLARISDEIEAQQRSAEPGGISMRLPEASSWWTKSKWAFLNDPPTVDIKQSKYVPQFDVASLGQLQTEHPAF